MEGEQPYLGGLRTIVANNLRTIVANNLVAGMILQVGPYQILVVSSFNPVVLKFFWAFHVIPIQVETGIFPSFCLAEGFAERWLETSSKRLTLVLAVENDGDLPWYLNVKKTPQKKTRVGAH